MHEKLPSPLDKIPDLEAVPPEKVKALEDRLRPRVEEARNRMIESAQRAQEIRKIPLF